MGGRVAGRGSCVNVTWNADAMVCNRSPSYHKTVRQAILHKITTLEQSARLARICREAKGPRALEKNRYKIGSTSLCPFVNLSPPVLYHRPRQPAGQRNTSAPAVKKSTSLGPTAVSVCLCLYLPPCLSCPPVPVSPSLPFVSACLSSSVCLSLPASFQPSYLAQSARLDRHVAAKGWSPPGHDPHSKRANRNTSSALAMRVHAMSSATSVFFFFFVQSK